MFGFLDSLRRRFARRQKPPKLQRAQATFRERHPQYEIGLGSYGMPIIHDWAEGTTLRIGAFTSIADQVHIFLGGHHRTDWVSSFPFPAFVEEARSITGYGGSRGDVIIGNDVWLATGCAILSGVTVGDGAVVAAYSVVSRDVAPYEIVAGNPARNIGWRFDAGTRERLLQTRWWSWPEAELRQITPLLCSDRVGDFLAYAAKRDQRRSGENQ